MLFVILVRQRFSRISSNSGFFSPYLSARLYWGYPLVNNAYEYDRKYGRFHFELALEPNFDALLRNRSTARPAKKEVDADFINNYDDVRHYDYFIDRGAL